MNRDPESECLAPIHSCLPPLRPNQTVKIRRCCCVCLSLALSCPLLLGLVSVLMGSAGCFSEENQLRQSYVTQLSVNS